MKNLTEKQFRTAEHYLNHGSMVDAYIHGYKCSYKTADSKASGFFKNPVIQEYIEKRREKRRKKSDIDKEFLEKKCLDQLERLGVNPDKEKLTDIVKAEGKPIETLAKLNGLFSEKKDGDGGLVGDNLKSIIGDAKRITLEY